MTTESTPFRCPVQPEQADGILVVGRKRVPVKLVDTSTEGFTLTVANKPARKLRHGVKWTLVSQGERTVVHPEWMFNSPTGDVQLGLRRLQDVTPVEYPHTRRSIIPGINTSSLSGVALAGMLMLIIAIICLPGVGDDLGTAPVVQNYLRDIFRDVAMAFRRFVFS